MDASLRNLTKTVVVCTELACLSLMSHMHVNVFMDTGEPHVKGQLQGRTICWPYKDTCMQVLWHQQHILCRMLSSQTCRLVSQIITFLSLCDCCRDAPQCQRISKNMYLA